MASKTRTKFVHGEASDAAFAQKMQKHRPDRYPILPSSDHILIEYLPASGLTAGGLFIPDSAVELDPTKRKWDKSYRARVLAVGPGRPRRRRNGMPLEGIVPTTLKPGDIIAIRQQNFPYEKRHYFAGARIDEKVYFARESDVDGIEE